MKKNLIVFSLLGLAVVSCKKTYTCDCEVSQTIEMPNGTTETQTIKNTSVAYSKKMTKKQATAACDHEAFAVKSSFANLAGGSSGQVPATEIPITCTVK